MTTEEKIRSRGHWRVLIRPNEFIEDRVDLPTLAEIVTRSQVRLRGWYFPHIKGEFQPGRDYIAQATAWDYHLESWRFYTSGQFADLIAINDDWRDISSLHPPNEGWRPGVVLSVWNPLYRFTEFFEFAARLALSDAGSESMVVEITTNGLGGRHLVVDDPRRSSFDREYVAGVPEHTYRRVYRREELVAQARIEAVRATRDLLHRFGWLAVTEEFLSGYQEELTRGS